LSEIGKLGKSPTLWFLNLVLEGAFSAEVGTGIRGARLETDLFGGVIHQGKKIETGALPEDLEKVTRISE